MNYEWSQWFRHDGKGCPCYGKFIQYQSRDGSIVTGVVGEFSSLAQLNGSESAWIWPLRGRQKFLVSQECIRYRVRRPLVSEWLAETTSDLPVKEDA
jgi:hypothetical protein